MFVHAIRAAREEDYPVFAKLFPELGAEQATPSRERFSREILPGCLVAELRGAVVAYLWFEVFGRDCHVRHVVCASQARRHGLARALMEAVRERACKAGAQRWRLNVRPQNAAAISLYEACGLRLAFSSRSLRMPWSLVDAMDSGRSGCTARPIEEDEEAHVEAATGLLAGQLREARAHGRVLIGAQEGGRIVGSAVFDPEFPGAYPFRAASLDIARTMLFALKPYRRPADDFLYLMFENQTAAADALVERGAELRLELAHFEGELTSEVRVSKQM